MADTRRGFAVAAAVAPAVIRAAAGTAESLGYDSFWVNDTPAGDGLVALAEANEATEVITLGVGVVPLSRRPPRSILDEIRALTHEGGHEGGAGDVVPARGRTEDVSGLTLPLDRLILGIGSGSGQHPLRLVRDGVRALREALDVPIYIAALGPKMSRLAGEVADGVLFNWLTADYARAAAEWVREGAEAAGRPVPALAAYVRVAVGAASAARLEQEAARYASIPSYSDHFRRMGVGPVEASIAVDVADDVRAALAAWDGVLDEVVVRSITPEDTIEETLALVEAAAPV